MKIVNKVQTAQNIDVKVHFLLEIQLQDFIKNFKANVLGDQRVMDLIAKILDEKDKPQAPNQGEKTLFEWPSSSYSAGDSLRRNHE